MRIVLHPGVRADILAVMEYYERVATPGLADDFYRELRQFMQEAAGKPETYSIPTRDLRRVNLNRFPYHFLFRIAGDTLRILVVRHHKRHPSFGLRRR